MAHLRYQSWLKTLVPFQDPLLAQSQESSNSCTPLGEDQLLEGCADWHVQGCENEEILGSEPGGDPLLEGYAGGYKERYDDLIPLDIRLLDGINALLTTIA